LKAAILSTVEAGEKEQLSLNVSQTGLWRLRSGYDLSGHLKVI